MVNRLLIFVSLLALMACGSPKPSDYYKTRYKNFVLEVHKTNGHNDTIIYTYNYTQSDSIPAFKIDNNSENLNLYEGYTKIYDGVTGFTILGIMNMSANDVKHINFLYKGKEITSNSDKAVPNLKE